MSREEALRLNPLVSPKGVTGGAVWYDYQMQSTDRVTLSFLLSAVEAGACAANYVQAKRFLQRDGRVIGVQAEDRLTNEPFTIRASVVVNAAGPWAASLLTGLPAAAQGAPPPRLSRAMNVVTRKVVERSRLRRHGQRPLPASWCPGATSRCSAPATTRTKGPPIS